MVCKYAFICGSQSLVILWHYFKFLWNALFLSAIWLIYGQLQAIIEGRALLTQCQLLHISSYFKLKVTQIHVKRRFPKPGGAPSEIWPGFELAIPSLESIKKQSSRVVVEQQSIKKHQLPQIKPTSSFLNGERAVVFQKQPISIGK